MIKIEKLRFYYENDKVFVTEHAAERFRQRGIKTKDIRAVISNGEIIEQYPDDFPFPSCLITGYDEKGSCIHVCMSDEGSCARIVTAYYPDKELWSEDFRQRLEK